MPQFTIITGNPNKLAEFKRLLPAGIAVDHAALDINEIQSFDPVEIVTDKVKRAYALVKKPVVVEDVSAGIDKLQGLPGPFIKYFEQRLGKGALYQLAGEVTAATITCVMAYYDGSQLIIGTGTVHGTVGPPMGDNGFGFDFGFTPTGHNKTFAQMTPAGKDALSHRSLAVQDLLRQLKRL